jgi:hypothetical protein
MEKGHEIRYMECKEPHTREARELQKYKLDLVVYRTLSGTKWALWERENFFFMENEKIIIYWEKDFLYTTE